ncbi:MAG: BatA domain-containing protein [Pirellulaceae bacterium]|nr:BatA domain-containing protein [Planctomycetales bacterium]
MISFVQSGFLFAGLAVAIPLAIHLLLKQRARRVDIGSIRLLQLIMRQQNRMRRLREWLLLAARIITVLLLAMLFARPYFDKTASEANQQEYVLMLDSSASMRSKDSDGLTLFDRAYQGVLDELATIHENAIVHIATFSGSDVQELQWEDRGPLVRPEPAFGPTDYGRALSWARDVLEGSQRTDRHVMLFTDLQQTGMSPGSLAESAPRMQVTIRDFGTALSRNVGVTRVEAIANEIRPQLPPKVLVEVRNFGPLLRDMVPVSLRLQGPDGVLEYEQMASVPAGGSTRVVFEIDHATPGIYEGAAAISIEDDLTEDNRRFVAFEARHPDRVLLVDGDEGSSVFGSETYYLETALNLGKTLSRKELPSFETERIIWENGEGFPDLNGFRVIVLANIGRFSTTDATRLQNAVLGGARLLIFPGDKFTSLSAAPLQQHGLLPASHATTGEGSPYRVTTWDTEHPMFRPFADPEYGDLRRLQFRQVIHMTPVADATTPAELQNHWPLLVEKTLGTGRIAMFATTADAAWSSWPRERLYVPVVHQLLEYLTDQHLREESISESVATQQVGLVHAEKRIDVQNIAPRESAMARVSVEEFRQQYGLLDADELAELTPAERAALAAPVGSERPNEAWKAVAWLLMGWMILETFLASRVHT